MQTPRNILSSLIAVSLTALASSTYATPYACDLTNNAGVVSFRLNENADNVKIISSGGTITNDIGPGIKGLTITNLGVAVGTIKVMVTRSAPAGYTQTSSDSLQEGGVYVNKFEQPRGITVNKNPATASFGRIYVSNGRVGTTGTLVRNTMDGIYLLNSDNTIALDTGTTPRTADLPFDTANAVSPFRLSIGKDDGLLYISDDSDSKGGLWVCDLDVATNSIATNVFDTQGDLSFGATNHGSIYTAWIEGSLGANNLKVFTLDEDLVPVRSAWRYDVNSGPLPWTGPTNLLNNTGFINTALKLVRGGVSNYFYASQNRSAGTDGPSILIFSESGTVTNSLAYTRSNFNASGADIFRNVTSIDISPDGNTLALLRGSAFGTVLLVPLTNGVITTTGTNAFSSGTGRDSDNNRDISYDAAGNLYIINTASEFLRIYSKGGASVAITGTDGTFVMGVPPTIVSVTASTATANEQGPVNGVFTLTRNGDISVPLTVNYTVGGTATATADYTTLSGSVTFLANASSTNITVTIADDLEAELTETVILTLTGSGVYGVSGGPATVSILDNEPTEVSLTLAQTEARLLEGYSAAKVGFRLTRRGLIGPALTANLAYSGSATAGADFGAPGSVAIGASVATVNFNLTSIDDESYEGSETATVNVTAGAGYAVGPTSSASATVIDDDYPAGVVLFADNFDVNSAANWVVNSVDGGLDSAADFAFDYSTLYVPAVAGGSSSTGLRFRLNEQTGAPINAISASPLGLSLSGDYRLRFKMWVNYNGPMLDGGAGSTMHLTAGVGTSGDHANLATSGASDGIWFDFDGDGGSTFAIGDCSAYIAFTLQEDASGVYAAGTTDNPRSTTNPYYSLWGGLTAPAAQLANYPGQTGTSQAGNLGISWHTVVITKATNAVSLVVDGIPISTVPADSLPASGNVFVGFEDLFAGASSVPAMSFAVVENLRVETYLSAPIIITDIKRVGNNVEVTFSGPAEVSPSYFKLLGSATVNGTYNDEGASIISVGPGLFKATKSVGVGPKFYRIKYSTEIVIDI